MKNIPSTLIFKNTGNSRHDMRISTDNVYTCCACSAPMPGICFKNLPKRLYDHEKKALSEHIAAGGILGDVIVTFESAYNFFCEKCSSSPCIITFMCNDGSMPRETRVELATNVTFGKFLSYSSSACDKFIANISSKKCYLFETKEEITNDHMFCNGNKYILTIDKDIINFNHLATTRGKTIWNKFPARLKLKISLKEVSTNGEIKMFIPHVDTHQNLKEIIDNNEFDTKSLNSVETLVEELLSMSILIPQIRMTDIYIFQKCRVKLLPFYETCNITKTELATKTLLENIITYYSNHKTNSAIMEKLLKMKNFAIKKFNVHLEKKRKFTENYRNEIEKNKQEQKRISGLIVLSDFKTNETHDKRWNMSSEYIQQLAKLDPLSSSEEEDSSTISSEDDE